MRLLLDTHVWVWAAIRPDRLRPEVREEIEAGTDIVVSTVVAFEVAVKQALGKLEPAPGLTIVTADPLFARYDVSLLAP